MKIKHTVEISALDLALFLKEKLCLKCHHGDLDLEVVGMDNGGFAAPKKGLKTLFVAWEEGSAESSVNTLTR